MAVEIGTPTQESLLLKLAFWLSKPLVAIVFAITSSLAIWSIIQINIHQQIEFNSGFYLSLFIPLAVAIPATYLARLFINKIESQKIALEKANELKNTLFSIIAHDLRSPLATLSELLEFSKDNETNETYLKQHIQAINEQMQNSINLLDNLLKWSHSQLKGLQPQFRVFDIKDIAIENLSLLSQQAKNKNIFLDNQIRQSSLIKADKDMIKLVIRNLISNAIKFTPNNGIISLLINNEQGNTIISVRDNGVGLSNQDREQILVHNEHFSKQGTNNEKGTGLGLMLCKEFIERHGGRFWIESELGMGSTFRFSIPQ
ncbi:MAG: HAMP domain-containing histidine kinase [Gammaproteobacteria bacterium]|nr:HAMP domain-containing histidine kinase [Gammaproteobacteria bacterium]MDH5728835.1 HAMP domain-containing histidine kinase [Gammaproteobacteria bacterium]